MSQLILRSSLLLICLGCWIPGLKAQTEPDAESRVSRAMTTGALEHYAGIEKAAALYAAKNFREAATLYTKLTNDDPKNGDLWIRQGKSYQNAGDAQMAIAA